MTRFLKSSFTKSGLVLWSCALGVVAAAVWAASLKPLNNNPAQPQRQAASKASLAASNLKIQTNYSSAAAGDNQSYSVQGAPDPNSNSDAGGPSFGAPISVQPDPAANPPAYSPPAAGPIDNPIITCQPQSLPVTSACLRCGGVHYLQADIMCPESAY
jgi:hypothetical protein